MTIEKLALVIESILFVAGDAVALSDIADKLQIDRGDVKKAAEILGRRYCGECGINLLSFNGKLQFASNPAYIEDVSAVLNPIREKELTKAMLETLSIIAYKQPITRIEIEEIRGVDCTYALQTLLRLNMIIVVGKKDAIGKPMLFGTTDEFLRHFSLSSLEDLPDYEQLLERIKTMKTDEGSSDLYDIHSPSEPAETAFDDELPDFLEGEDVEKITADEE